MSYPGSSRCGVAMLLHTTDMAANRPVPWVASREGPQRGGALGAIVRSGQAGCAGDADSTIVTVRSRRGDGHQPRQRRRPYVGEIRATRAELSKGQADRWRIAITLDRQLWGHTHVTPNPKGYWGVCHVCGALTLGSSGPVTAHKACLAKCSGENVGYAEWQSDRQAAKRAGKPFNRPMPGPSRPRGGQPSAELLALRYRLAIPCIRVKLRAVGRSHMLSLSDFQHPRTVRGSTYSAEISDAAMARCSALTKKRWENFRSCDTNPRMLGLAFKDPF
jgi:hypothetical protein